MGEYSERELLGVLKAVMLWDVLAGVSFSQAKAADVAAPRPGASTTCAAPGASSSIPIGSMGAHRRRHPQMQGSEFRIIPYPKP